MCVSCRTPLDAFDFVISRQKTYVADVPINVDLEV
jgi:hypothetical protein